MLAQSDTECAQTAAGHISRVGVEHLPHQIGVFPQLFPAARICNGSPDHRIRMTNQILSARLDRDINIEFQSFEQNASRPVLSIMMTASGATRLTALTMLGISCTSMVIEPGIPEIRLSCSAEYVA